MGVDSWMWDIDQRLSSLVDQWNGYTTAIVTVLLGLATYSLFTRKDPDTHPMLLARQAQSSPVRQEGESAVYRSHASPHGMPLNSGLNVKDTGASKWSRGRDGDLRDIWRRVVAGVPEGEGSGRGRLLTVHGVDVVEHDIENVTRQINIIGQHILEHGGNRVAIYLPNSVELIAALFACAFYNLTAILIPFDQPEEAVISMLRRSAADTVVAPPGTFPFDAVTKSYPSLRNVVWVASDGNRHMDWNEVPQGTGGAVNVATWQDLVSEQSSDVGRDLPPIEGQKDPRDVTVFWQSSSGDEMVRFTSANLISAVAAQIFAVPTSQRLGPADLFLPAAPLTDVYVLTLTLAALYSNSSVAFNSSASRAKTLALATRAISPTVVVVTPDALLQTRAEAANALTSLVARTLHGFQTRTLTRDGVMATPAPGKLRLVFAAEKAGAGTPPLSSAALSDVRVLTGARVMYALTGPKVAGPVTQTGFYDYRVQEDEGDKGCSHFGPPVTSTEIMLRDKGAHKTSDDTIEGEIIVRGPSVAGNEAALGVLGRILEDNTLAYI